MGGLGVYFFCLKEKDIPYENNKSQYTKVAYKGEYLYSVIEYCEKNYAGEKCYNDDEKDIMLGTSVIIPKLTLKTDTAKKINQDIYNDSKSLIEENIKKKEMDSEFYSHSVEYESIDKDDIVFIKVLSSGGGLHSEGYASYDYYYYDVKNDKALTNTEVMNHFGITTNDLNKAIKESDFDEEVINEAGYDNISNLDFPVYPKDNNIYSVYFANLGMDGIEVEIQK